MRVCLLSFSGRVEPGNCYKVLQYISEVLENKAVESTLLAVTDYKINGCHNCTYECFSIDSTHCPKHDDVAFLYETVALHDLAIIALPVYSGAPCSLYFAFNERSQSAFDNSVLFDRYSKITKNYIVIGNEDAGGSNALNMVLATEEKLGEALLLQSHLYGQNSILGGLAEVPRVRTDLENFVERILAKK